MVIVPIIDVFRERDRNSVQAAWKRLIPPLRAQRLELDEFVDITNFAQ